MLRVALHHLKVHNHGHLPGSDPVVAVELDGQALQQLGELGVEPAMRLDHQRCKVLEEAFSRLFQALKQKQPESQERPHA